MDVSIEAANPESMPDADVLSLYELERLLHEEAYPEDPPPTWQAFAAQMRSPRPHAHRRRLLLRVEGRLAGSALVQWRLGAENRHLARVHVEVGPAHRRQALGRALLRASAEYAAADGRTLLQSWTTSRVPAGEAFCRAVGAEQRSISHENRLDLGEVDRDQLERWVAAGEAQPDYDLVFVEAPTPAELLPAAAEIANVMNSAPRDDLDEEDETITPEQLASWDQANAAGGRRAWRYYVQHRPSARMVGLTEMGWDPLEPRTISQGDTGVLPAHRGHGLAKWIKAAMLLRVMREVPEARIVVTGNAMSNDAMLAINRALGFRPAGSWSAWQLETERAR